MPFLYFVLTYCFASFAGFLIFCRGGIFDRSFGQVIQGLVVVPCFAFIGWAFWFYGWKAGIAEAVILFIGGRFGMFTYEFVASRHRR